jgi:hypothetical protein
MLLTAASDKVVARSASMRDCAGILAICVEDDTIGAG